MKYLTNFFQHALIVGSLSIGFSNVAKAKGLGCEETGGAVVFKNTLYGIGLGGIISGLIILADGNGDDAGRKIANGGLVGAGFGLAYGIYDVATREQSNLTESVKPGWSTPALVANPAQSSYALSMRYNF